MDFLSVEEVWRYSELESFKAVKKLFEEDMEKFLEKYPPEAQNVHSLLVKVSPDYWETVVAISWIILSQSNLSWPKEDKRPKGGLGSMPHLLDLLFKATWMEYIALWENHL